MYKNIAITKVVFVTSMNYNTSEQDLRNFFESCGKITNIRFLYDKNEVATGSAYVAFETHEMALKAYAKDDTCLRDRFLRISLNRTDAIEEIMTKKENTENNTPIDEKTQENIPSFVNDIFLQNTENKKGEKEEKRKNDNKGKSHKDSKKEHKHHHKNHHHHKHHKHDQNNKNKESSSDEGVRYYTELPE